MINLILIDGYFFVFYYLEFSDNRFRNMDKLKISRNPYKYRIYLELNIHFVIQT